MRSLVVMVTIALAACGYGASFGECAVACTPSSGCPTGLECGTDGLCRSSPGMSCGGATDAPMLPDCVGSDLNLDVNLCLTGLPSSGITISSNTSFNTDNGSSSDVQLTCGTLTGSSTPQSVCPIIATTITINNGVTLFGIGSEPLVLIATESIDIEGTIDVASHNGGSAGAGTLMGCHGESNQGAGGGGAGGSYLGSGGTGGNNDSGGNGGSPGNPIALTAPSAGCPGGGGGSSGGSGGAGGGVVIIATPSLVLGSNGTINASGASGKGASTGQRGGGGGGTGGLIALSVSSSLSLGGGAQIYANGGPGGGGSTTSTSGNGGTDPSGASSGGSGGSGGTGGNGGTGATRESAVSNGVNSSGTGDGGGGGGGATGVILIQPTSILNAVSSNADISPTPTP